MTSKLDIHSPLPQVGSPIIEVQDLHKTYRKGNIQAVKGISFQVKAGTCFGILGPNGAGKSTTLEIMQGLNAPTSGKVKIFGMEYGNHEKAIRKRIGGILQENHLYSKLLVCEALELFQSFYENPATIDEILTELELQDLKKRPLRQLSGGQRQRVFIGTALIGNPELVFLDEPTTGLDPSTRQDFWKIMIRLKNRGKTLVLTTHYMEEAEALCDELVIVNQGIVIEKGSPDAIIERVMKGRELPARPRLATLNDVFLTLTGHTLES